MEWKLSLKIDLQSPVPIEAGITAILYLQYLGMLVTGYMAGVQSADARSNPSSVITRHQQPAAASSRIQAGHGDGDQENMHRLQQHQQYAAQRASRSVQLSRYF